jgi:HAD superfamily hydrolase (TIGR01458 family)
MGAFEAVLLDMDGVLAISWQAIPGAADAIAYLREQSLPFRIVTNTTTHTRRRMAAALAGAGLEIDSGDIVTAVVATASYLREHHPGARVFLLSDGDATEDLEGITLVDSGEADVVVLGGASDDFTYDAMGRIFRMLMDGAALVGMHRNMYWRTSRGLELDAGMYLSGLEQAAGVKAAICGKPAPAFFSAALEQMGAAPERSLMVGDDLANDVLAAKALGLSGALVRTGKFLASDLDRGEPDHVLDSVEDLPDLLASA